MGIAQRHPILGSFMIKFFPLFLTLFFLSTHADSVEGISLPSGDVLTNFVRDGRILKVNFKIGQRVKAGDVLATLDSSTEKKKLKQQEFLAKSVIDIQRFAKELVFKKKSVNHIREAVKKGAAAPKELSDAELEQVRTEMDLLKAKFEQKQHELKLHELQTDLIKFQLRSSLSGIIEDVKIEVGENADLREPAFRIVQIDPLWIDAAIPTQVAKKLSIKDKLKLTFPTTPGLKSNKTGTIIYVSSLADSASDTINIRLAINNKEQRLVGERVVIHLPNASKK